MNVSPKCKLHPYARIVKQTFPITGENIIVCAKCNCMLDIINNETNELGIVESQIDFADGTNFDYISRIKPNPSGTYGYDDMITCPKCKGHGQYNYRYVQNMDHTNKYWTISCSQCNGWGYIVK